jgi:TolA protein
MALRDESCAVVRKAVARFYDQRKRDDLLFLYFSGHGVKDEQGHLYLALRDTEVGLLAGTAIETSFISDRMDRSFSKRQVLVLDCCHSGAFAHGTKSAQGVSVGTAQAFEGTGLGRVILTATDATQYAWDGDHLEGEPQNSVFTRYLIEGLKSGAADQDADGVVTVDELYDYVHEQVVNTTPRQTPYKWSYRQQGEIVLAHNPFVKSGTLPPALRDAVAGISPLVRLDAVRDLQLLLRGQDVGQSHAALAALKVLTQDDSRKVATAAIEALRVRESEHHEQQVAPPAPPTTQGDPPPVSLPLEPPVEDRSGGRPSDVFISYAREDQETAKALANVLSAKGWKIWWDRKIAPGESFDKAIERQLKTCKCAIVLWSTHSVDATWVRNEARRAARRSVLLPILIEAVEPPLEFDDLQAVDLISWKVPTEHPEFEALFNRIQELAGVPLDTRARIAVERARGEFAAGRRNAAIAILAEFQPVHAQVTRALDFLRREAANIAREEAETARRAQEAAERQRALAAEQTRIDDLLERGEIGAADRTLTTAEREFGVAEFTQRRTRWNSLAAQSAADERARSTIEAARREFAAGGHQTAIASLAGFRPVHELVVEALNELREEAAHIARERADAQAEADRVAREQAEAAQRAENAAQKQHALAAAQTRIDELLSRGELDAADRALASAEQGFGRPALASPRERWTRLRAQALEDERARAAVDNARRESAAGRREAAVASLAGFQPEHAVVTAALHEMREEIERIARQQIGELQRAEEASQRERSVANAQAHIDEQLGLGQLEAADQALDEAEREFGQSALLPLRERSKRHHRIEGVVVPGRAPRLFPTRFATAAASVVVVAVSVWLVRQPAAPGDSAVIQPGDSTTSSSSGPSAIEEPAVTPTPPAPVVVETAAIEPPAPTPPVPDRSPQPRRVDEQAEAKRREELRQAADAAQRAREAEQAQEAKRLQDEKLAAESQAAKKAAEAQQAQEAKRLQEQKLAAEAQAAKKAAEAEQAQEAKRLQEQKLAAEAQAAKKAAEAQQAQEAKRLQELKQGADAQAARFFEAIRGDWVHEEDQRTQETRTQTQELLAMDAGCSGTLTRNVSSYERGFAGWKRVGSQTTRLAIRCDAAGRVSGELNTRLSMDGVTLVLGTSRFVRR